jgi:peptide/nickel transport system substrate-binding protein
MLLAGCGGGTSQNSTSTAFRIGNTPWASSISYNPYNPDYVPFATFTMLGLGAVSDWNHPGSNPYYPELATGWTVANSSITFHLRPAAKWQNGAPFTSKDVVTSLLGAGADYNSVWGSMRSVSAPNAHTVTVELQSWAVAQTVLLHLLEVPIIPTSEYGFLFPSGFEQNVKSYWTTYDLLHPTGSTISAASNSSAGKALSAVSSKMIKFNPSKLLGNGPYTLQSANVSGVLYKKWDGWWDASKMSAPWVQIYPMSVSSQYGSLSTGSIEFQQDAQFTDPQVAKLNQSKGGHYIFIPSPVQQESLVFHLDSYPFGILAVRQAFAYVIDRTKLTQLDMGGTLIQDPPTIAPDGINDFLGKSFLTKDQFASMNHYSLDQSKAASLLEGAGFTKKDGTWYTPKGQPFTVTIDEEAGYAQLDEDGIVLANDLKSFGIKADTDDVNAATYVTEEEAGDLAVSEQFMDWGQGSPMADFAATFGQPTTPAWNYAISYGGSGPCNCAIGIGPTSDVPGLGNVNVASALNDEVNSAEPNTWPGYIWDWSRWVNQNLPILPLYNNAFHEAYSTARYSDYPPASQKWLWTGLDGAAQPVLWMQEGYLKLKSTSS